MRRKKGRKNVHSVSLHSNNYLSTIKDTQTQTLLKKANGFHQRENIALNMQCGDKACSGKNRPSERESRAVDGGVDHQWSSGGS